MTADEYKTHLRALEWSHAGAALRLGISPRMSQYYAAGRHAVPQLVEWALQTMLAAKELGREIRYPLPPAGGLADPE